MEYNRAMASLDVVNGIGSLGGIQHVGVSSLRGLGTSSSLPGYITGQATSNVTSLGISKVKGGGIQSAAVDSGNGHSRAPFSVSRLQQDRGSSIQNESSSFSPGKSNYDRAHTALDDFETWKQRRLNERMKTSALNVVNTEGSGETYQHLNSGYRPNDKTFLDRSLKVSYSGVQGSGSTATLGTDGVGTSGPYVHPDTATMQNGEATTLENGTHNRAVYGMSEKLDGLSAEPEKNMPFQSRHHSLVDSFSARVASNTDKPLVSNHDTLQSQQPRRRRARRGERGSTSSGDNGMTDQSQSYQPWDAYTPSASSASGGADRFHALPFGNSQAHTPENQPHQNAAGQAILPTAAIAATNATAADLLGLRSSTRNGSSERTLSGNQQLSKLRGSGPQRSTSVGGASLAAGGGAGASSFMLHKSTRGLKESGGADYEPSRVLNGDSLDSLPTQQQPTNTSGSMAFGRPSTAGASFRDKASSVCVCSASRFMARQKAHYEHQLRRIEEERTQQQQRHEQLYQKELQVQKQQQLLQQQQRDLQQQNQELVRVERKINDERERVQQQLAEQQQQLALQQQEHQQQQELFQAKKDRWRAVAQQRKEEAHAVQDRHKEERRELDETRRLITKRELELQDLQDKLEAERFQLHSLRVEQEERQFELERATEEMNSNELHLKEQRAQLEKREEEVEKRADEMQNIEMETKRLHEEARRLQEKVKEQQQEVCNMREEAASFERNLREQEDEFRCKKLQLDGEEQRIQMQRSEILQQQQQLQLDRAKLDHERRNIEQERRSLEEGRDRLQQDNQHSQAALQRQREVFQSQCDAMTSQLEDEKSRWAEQRNKEQTELKRKAVELDKEIGITKQKQLEHDAAKATFDEETKVTEKKRQELEEQQQSLRHQDQEMRQQHTLLVQELEFQAQVRQQQLESEVQQLREKMQDEMHQKQQEMQQELLREQQQLKAQQDTMQKQNESAMNSFKEEMKQRQNAFDQEKELFAATQQQLQQREQRLEMDRDEHRAMMQERQQQISEAEKNLYERQQQYQLREQRLREEEEHLQEKRQQLHQQHLKQQQMQSQLQQQSQQHEQRDDELQQREEALDEAMKDVQSIREQEATLREREVELAMAQNTLEAQKRAHNAFVTESTERIERKEKQLKQKEEDIIRQLREVQEKKRNVQTCEKVSQLRMMEESTKMKHQPLSIDVKSSEATSSKTSHGNYRAASGSNSTNGGSNSSLRSLSNRGGSRTRRSESSESRQKGMVGRVATGQPSRSTMPASTTKNSFGAHPSNTGAPSKTVRTSSRDQRLKPTLSGSIITGKSGAEESTPDTDVKSYSPFHRTSYLSGLDTLDRVTQELQNSLPRSSPLVSDQDRDEISAKVLKDGYGPSIHVSTSANGKEPPTTLSPSAPKAAMAAARAVAAVSSNPNSTNFATYNGGSRLHILREQTLNMALPQQMTHDVAYASKSSMTWVPANPAILGACEVSVDVSSSNVLQSHSRINARPYDVDDKKVGGTALRRKESAGEKWSDQQRRGVGSSESRLGSAETVVAGATCRAPLVATIAESANHPIVPSQDYQQQGSGSGTSLPAPQNAAQPLPQRRVSSGAYISTTRPSLSSAQDVNTDVNVGKRTPPSGASSTRATTASREGSSNEGQVGGKDLSDTRRLSELSHLSAFAPQDSSLDQAREPDFEFSGLVC